MTDETFAGLNIATIYAGGNPKRKWAKLGEAFGPGDAIRVTSGVAYLAKASDAHVSGIADLLEGKEIDTDYTSAEVTAGILIPYFPKGQDTDVYLKIALSSPVVAIKPFDRLALSTVDGQMKNFVYTDGTQASDSAINMMGHALENDATHVTNMHIIKANLSN